MSRQNLECEDITKITEMKLNDEISKDITKMWERKCPQCDETIYHTSKCNRDRISMLNCVCRKCISKSQQLYKSTIKFERICNKCGKLTIYKNRKSFNQAEKENRVCINCISRRLCNEETKRKIGEKNRGLNNGMYGKTHSKEYKKVLSEKIKIHPLPHTTEGIKKMSVSLRKKYAENFKKFGFKGPRVNLNACEIIDNYGKENGYNFQHGLNGGEFYIKSIGVWLDGYDMDKNVVFEYDEPHHFNSDGSLKQKDIRRMDSIKLFLGCKFIRYNEKLNEIKEY